MALSLVVITGFVGQISVVQLEPRRGLGLHRVAPRGRRRHRLPAGAAGGRRAGGAARRARRPSRRCACAAWPRGGDARCRGGDRQTSGSSNPTWGGGDTGSPVPEPHLFGARPRAALGVPRPRRRAAQPGVRLARAGGDRRSVPVRRVAAAAGLRPADAGGRDRTSAPHRRPRVDVRTVKLVAFAISAFIAGIAGALYAYNFGSVSAEPVRGADRARLDRVRLRRRDHAGVRRRVRRADLDRGDRPARHGQVARGSTATGSCCSAA